MLTLRHPCLCRLQSRFRVAGGRCSHSQPLSSFSQWAYQRPLPLPPCASTTMSGSTFDTAASLRMSCRVVSCPVVVSLSLSLSSLLCAGRCAVVTQQACSVRTCHAMSYHICLQPTKQVGTCSSSCGRACRHHRLLPASGSTRRQLDQLLRIYTLGNPTAQTH